VIFQNFYNSQNSHSRFTVRYELDAFRTCEFLRYELAKVVHEAVTDLGQRMNTINTKKSQTRRPFNN